MTTTSPENRRRPDGQAAFSTAYVSRRRDRPRIRSETALTAQLPLSASHPLVQLLPEGLAIQPARQLSAWRDLLLLAASFSVRSVHWTCAAFIGASDVL